MRSSCCSRGLCAVSLLSSARKSTFTERMHEISRSSRRTQRCCRCCATAASGRWAPAQWTSTTSECASAHGPIHHVSTAKRFEHRRAAEASMAWQRPAYRICVQGVMSQLLSCRRVWKNYLQHDSYKANGGKPRLCYCVEDAELTCYECGNLVAMPCT